MRVIQRWLFPIIIALTYLILALIDLEKAAAALTTLKKLTLNFLPAIFLIIIFMILTNHFVQPKKLTRYLGKSSGIKGWIISIIAGIFSTGPIYAWYPLLAEFQKKGMRTSLAATFLYNRAVKLPLIPLLILYFGTLYTILLLIVMICFSVLQGCIVERLAKNS